MSFNDDDVMRLKERIKWVPKSTPPAFEVTLNLEDADALLARLEAAETAMHNHRELCKDPKCFVDEAWRKACGK